MTGEASALGGGRRGGVRPTLVALRALGVGDFLVALPALRALAAAFPEHRRLLAAPQELAPLAALSGAVDETVPAAPLAPLPRSLRPPAMAVNLHGRGPESHHVLLASGPRRLLAFAHPAVPESAAGPPWDRPRPVASSGAVACSGGEGAVEHETARWCRLLAWYGIPADPARLDLPRPAVPAPGAEGATVIHPGAASAARRWPPERFAAVARIEADAGRTVLVTAGPGEEPLARSVVSLAEALTGTAARSIGTRAGGRSPVGEVTESIRPAGPTDLLRLAAVIAAAGRVVCGDTGVAHLATALGTPSVVLFGPSSPARWGPPPDRPLHRVLWAGRTGPANGPRPDPGLLEITVGDVVEALAAVDRLSAPLVRP